MGQKPFHTKIFPFIFPVKTGFLKQNSCQVTSYSIFMKFSALKVEINIVSFSDIYIEFYLYFFHQILLDNWIGNDFRGIFLWLSGFL